MYKQRSSKSADYIKDGCYAWAKNEHLLDVLLHNFVTRQAMKNLNAIF